MELALMANRKPLCSRCIRMKHLPKDYQAKPGEECYMCCRMTFAHEKENEQ